MSELEIYKGMVKKMKDDEIKEITKVDKQILDKIEHILASELNCEEYDKFYNYFNEIKKPNIIIDIKDDANIKDYITNLQQKEELFEKIVYKYDELKQENERLKETNVYCNRTDCVGRIKDSKKYDSVYQEKEDYKSRCEKALKLAESYELGKYDYSIPAGGIIELKDILNGRSDE